MSQTILYARVSTAQQTLAHQQTQAEEKGFVFDEILADQGESGRKPSCASVRRAAGSSTCCAGVTCWWSAGSTASAATMRT